MYSTTFFLYIHQHCTLPTIKKLMSCFITVFSFLKKANRKFYINTKIFSDTSKMPPKTVPSPPNITDGNATNFWRCKHCGKVNFRSASLCVGCNHPQPSYLEEGDNGITTTNNSRLGTANNNNMLSPASVGYLRSSAAVAVNAKVASLQEMLEDQKRKYEGDIVTLRKQLDHALQAHNSLLASQRQYMATHHAPGTARPNSNSNNASNSALETGYQQQITLLQEQLDTARKERDMATNELSTIKIQQQELIGKCEVAATEYAAVMKQLEESEDARNSLLDKLQKKETNAIEPPVNNGANIPAQSSAILNLEREINELKSENENLRSRVTELSNALDNNSTVSPGLSHRASADTLKGNQSQADIGGSSPGSDDMVIEALRSAINSKSESSIEQALNDANQSIVGLKKEVSYLKMSNEGMKKQLDEYETELTELEDREKEKTVEWERERDSLKKKIAQVEKEVQEADGRERDSCLTMNAMDAILSDALFSLKKVDEEKQQQQQDGSSSHHHHQQSKGGFMTFGNDDGSPTLGANVALAGSGSQQGE